MSPHCGTITVAELLQGMGVAEANDGFVEGAKEEVKQRLRSPYVVSFLVAWCAVNYEFLIVVFSEGEYVNKIGYIAQHLYREQSWWHVFGLPALLALIPVISIPVLNELAERCAQLAQVAGTYASVWIDTGKRKSDPELRELARNRAFEIEAIRRHTIDTMSLYGQLVFAGAVKFTDEQEGWARLKIEDPPSMQGVTDLTALVRRAGFPSLGLEMLEHLADEGTRSQNQLRSLGSSKASDDIKKWNIAFLLGARLIKFDWEHGAEPMYGISKSGMRFLMTIQKLNPGQLQIYGQANDEG